MPAGVVGLGHQEHDIEDLVQRGEVAQVIGPHLGVDLALPQRDMQAVGAHGLDMGRPLVDEHDIEPRIGEVGRDAASVGAGAENGDFLVHRVSKARVGRGVLRSASRLAQFQDPVMAGLVPAIHDFALG